MFLREKRNAEAEKVARACVRTLENTDRPSLLAEALTRHGTALAPLGLYTDSLTAFRRAISLCQQTDSLNRAADIAFTAFYERGEHLAIKGAITTSGRPLDEEVLSLEHELIKHALEKGAGQSYFCRPYSWYVVPEIDPQVKDKTQRLAQGADSTASTSTQEISMEDFPKRLPEKLKQIRDHTRLSEAEFAAHVKARTETRSSRTKAAKEI